MSNKVFKQWVDAKHAYIISCDGEFDQVCETKADAERERDDLKAMGHNVKIKIVLWEDQDKIIERMTR